MMTMLKIFKTCSPGPYALLTPHPDAPWGRCRHEVAALAIEIQLREAGHTVHNLSWQSADEYLIHASPHDAMGTIVRGMLALPGAGIELARYGAVKDQTRNVRRNSRARRVTAGIRLYLLEQALQAEHPGTRWVLPAVVDLAPTQHPPETFEVPRSAAKTVEMAIRAGAVRWAPDDVNKLAGDLPPVTELAERIGEASLRTFMTFANVDGWVALLDKIAQAWQRPPLVISVGERLSSRHDCDQVLGVPPGTVATWPRIDLSEIIKENSRSPSSRVLDTWILRQAGRRVVVVGGRLAHWLGVDQAQPILPHGWTSPAAGSRCSPLGSYALVVAPQKPTNCRRSHTTAQGTNANPTG